MEKHDELLLALRKVIRAIDLHSKQLNKYSGLTAPQLLILREIIAGDGITASQVAQNITLSPATVSNVIERMELRGLIHRQRSATDKRRVLLYLSDYGQTLLDKAPQPLQHDFIQKFQALEQWEQSLLLSSMQRIATMMDAERLQVPPVLEMDSYHTMDSNS